MTPDQNSQYLIIDVETSPTDLEKYFDLNEEEKQKQLNAIDSRIIAAGILHQGKSYIFLNSDEKKLLTDFWETWSSLKRGDKNIPVVGFNICEFDMPLLVARSFINNVVIAPFVLKELVDLRQKLSAYKWRPKGKLKEFAELVGLEMSGEDGSLVAGWTKNKEWDKIKTYLESDLKMTDQIYQRALSLNITQIDRW